MKKVFILMLVFLVGFYVGAMTSPHWISKTRKIEHLKGIIDGVKLTREQQAVGFEVDTDSLNAALINKAYNYHWSENKEKNK